MPQTDPIIREMLAEQAYGSIYSTGYADAQRSATANETARSLGLPADIVEAALPDMMAEDRVRRINAEAQQNAAYARMMANQRLAKAAADDQHLPQVASRVDDHISVFSPAYIGMAATHLVGGLLGDTLSGVANYVRGIGETATENRQKMGALGQKLGSPLAFLHNIPDPMEALGPIGRALSTTPDWISDQTQPQTGNSGKDAMLSGFRSVGSSLGALAATFATGNPAVGTSILAGSTGGLTYRQARSKGLSANDALDYATMDAAIEAATEFLPEKMFSNVVKETGGSVAKRITKAIGLNLLTEVPGEVAATAGQSFDQWYWVDRKQGQSFHDYLATLPEQERQTIIAVLTTSAVLGPAGTVMGRMINRHVDQQSAANVNRIMEAAAKSTTRTANPSDFAEALNQLVGDTGADTLYIPADKVQSLFQTDDGGVGRNVADDPYWSRHENAISEASALGGDVVIPLSEAATHLAGTPDWAALKDHVRTRPGGMSLAEAQEQKPDDLEKIAVDMATHLDEKLPQLHAQRLTREFAKNMGYEGEQADAISQLVASAMGQAHAVENAKRASRGEAKIGLDEFSQTYLPQATKTTQAKFDRQQQQPAEAAQTEQPNVTPQGPFSALNTAKYEAVPIGEYLGSINGQQGTADELNDTHRRGNISIARDTNGLMSGAVIRAFEAANFSTAVHELGHFFIEDLKRRALSTDATEQEKADWQTFRDWAAGQGHNIGDDNLIPTEAHENWARGFERYIWEGKAPSAKLRVLFARMRDFMLALYRAAGAFKAPITPEVRSIMDRMLASEDEIEAQRNELKLVGEHLAGLMSEAERKAYSDLGDEAREEARSSLYERVLRTLKQSRDKELAERKQQIRGEVASAIDAQPIFTALRLLRSGVPREDGTTARATLSRQWLIENYGDDILDKLPKGVPPIIDERHAFEPEALAELAGYGSADAMVSALETHESERQALKAQGDTRSPRQALIDQGVERRVADEIGDPYENLEEEAQAAVANEKQADRLSLELRALARKTGKRATPWKMAAEWAKGHIRAQTTKDALSGNAIQMYARNAAKAARNVEEALVKQDYQAAFTAKQQQILNMALLQQAKQAKDEVDKAVRRLQRIAGKATITSVDQDYLDQAHQLLEAVDMKTRSGKATDKRLAFEAWHAAQVAKGIEPVVPPEYRATLGKTNWKRLSIADLLDLDQAVSQVVELGRLKQRLKDGKKSRDFNEAVAEMQASAEQLRERTHSKTTDDRRSLPGRLRSILRSADAAMLKLEQLAQWLDNEQQNGPWSRMLFNVLADAQGHETDLLRAYTKDINALIKALPKRLVRSWQRIVDTPELVIRNAHHLNNGEAFRGTKDQIVMMALNWGNTGNAQRLLDGFGWDEQAVHQVFERVMTKEDWDFVQGVWDTVDKLWPDVAALEREVNGVAPEKVEAMQVQTPFGTYRGGYFPVVYDPTQSTRAALNEEDSLSPNGGWHTVTTRSSASQARVAAVKGRPLLLSMNVITRHLGEVIHDITHRQAISQVKRLLSDPRINSLVNTRLGPEYAKAMGAMLENVARPGSSFSKDNPALVALGRYLNKGVSLVGLGFRVTTSLTQLLGIPVAGGELGAKYLAQGIAIVSAHPVQAWREMTARSAEMRARADTLDATIEDMIHEQANGKLKPIGPTGLSKYAFQGIAYMDMVVTTTVWTGAFNKGLAEGMTEEEAARYGDKAVRTTQGTGGMKDRSGIQNAHPLVRALYPFFSYMNALYNMQRDTFRRGVAGFKKGLIRDPAVPDSQRRAEAAREVGDAFRRAWWVMVVPALLQALFFGDGPDDDDGDGVTVGDWAAWLIKSVVLGNLGSLPLIGNLASAVGNGYTYRSSAYQQIGEGLVNGIKQGKELATDDEPLKGSTIQSVLTTVGLITAKPLGQVGATARGIHDYATGEADPKDAGDWYELLTKGRISDHPTAAERMLGETD